jgi:hypothetical protein
MPLLVGGSSYNQLLPELTGGELWWVKKQTPGTAVATWIDPDGVLYPLTQPWSDGGSGYFTMNGPSDWGSTPIELVTDPYPRGGEVVRYIRAQARRLQWPLYVGGDSHTEFVKNYRAIMKGFTKTTYRRAPGILEIQRPDGSARRIQAFYEQGFEGTAGENWLWAKPTVQLFCPDGYWYDPLVVNYERLAMVKTPGSEPGSFYQPFINIGSSPLNDDDDYYTLINNTGDVEAWPTWTVVGPIGGMTALNETTGQRFNFTYNVPAGVTVTITTNPASVRSSTGLNLSRYIDWFNEEGTALWPLAAGYNSITLGVTTMLPGSSVSMKFMARYESA